MRVAYVGPYLSTAPGSAAMQRALGIARSIVAAGGHVTVVADGEPCEESHAGIEIVSVPAPATSSKLGKGLHLLTRGHRLTSWLNTRPDLDVVIIYGGGSLFARELIAWSKDRGVPAVVDAVEWYDPRHQPLGRFGPVAVDFELAMRRTYAKAGNVIAISQLLYDHFASMGCRTIRIPPTTDVKSLPWAPTTPAGPLRLAYAGTPGRKDLLDVVVRGIQLADPTGTRCRLDIVGPTTDSLHQLVTSLRGGPWLTTHGRLPRSEALQVVRNAHFVPLVRTDARYANAGFPTKVAESMSVGTPVICNLTSDLALHVRDGETGLLSANSTAESFAVAVRRALELTPEQHRTMRAQTRAEAELVFDYRPYVNSLAAYFDEFMTSRAHRRG